MRFNSGPRAVLAAVLAGGCPTIVLSCGGAPFAAGPSDAGTTGEASADDSSLPPGDGGPADARTDDVRAADARAPGDGAPPPAEGGATVSGRVVDAFGAPLANATVRVAGAATTTDASGKFSLASVPSPYDAVVIATSATGSKHGYVFGGLTRVDPTLQVLFEVSSDGHAATITGTTATGHTPGVTGVVFADLPASVFAAGGNFIQVPLANDAFTGSATWIGATPTSATLYDLQWFAAGDGGPPTAYIAYASQGMPLASGQTAMFAVPASTTLPAATLQLTVSVTSGYALVETSFYLRPTGATIAAPIFHDPSGANPASLVTPSIPGATLVACAVQALTGTVAGTPPYGIACDTGLGAGSNQATTLTPPPAPTFVGPPSTANVGTTFSWNAVPDAINLVVFEPSSSTASPGPSLYLVTPAASARIPDLAAAGVALASGTSYTATVYALAPFTTTDSAAGPSGFGAIATAVSLGVGPAVPGALAFSGASPFTVQ